jgi:hypothetical protein
MISPVVGASMIRTHVGTDNLPKKEMAIEISLDGHY